MIRQRGLTVKASSTLSLTPSRFKFTQQNKHFERKVVRQSELINELMEGIPLKFRKSLRKIVDFYEEQLSESKVKIAQLTSQVANLTVISGSLRREIVQKQELIVALTGQLGQMTNIYAFTNEVNSGREDKTLHELRQSTKRAKIFQKSQARLSNKVNELSTTIQTISQQLKQLKAEKQLSHEENNLLNTKLKEAKIMSIKRVVSQQKFFSEQMSGSDRFSIFKMIKKGFHQRKPEISASPPFRRNNSFHKKNHLSGGQTELQEDEEYGKEKVVQKKKIRTLLQALFASHSREDATLRLRQISEEIGLKLHELEQLKSNF